MWRFLALKPAANHTVICPDLRAMAKELVEVMAELGFATFTLIGHDRGGRVAYRMAPGSSEDMERLEVFDMIPIVEAWSRTDTRFAQTYWPWILLSPKRPLPESFLPGAPKAVFDNPVRVHGICEEYRAAATIDVEYDRADNVASMGLGKRRDRRPLLSGREP